MNKQSSCGRDPSAVVIAGTTEGRESIGLLAGLGLHLTIFVATELGKDVLAKVPGIARMDVRVGRKSKEEFYELFGQLKPLFVVDASHPYAVQVTEAAAAACEKWKIPYIRFLREPAVVSSLAVYEYGQQITSDSAGGHLFVQAGEDAAGLFPARNASEAAADAADSGTVRADAKTVHLLYAQDAAQAAGLLQTLEGPVLLTTGSNTVHIYAERMPDFEERCYVRVLDTPGSLEACRKAGLPMSHVIKGMPPFTTQENLDLIRSLHIRVLVTKDSGKTGGLYEKLESARLAHIPVLIIRRPAEAVETVHANRTGQSAGKEQQGFSQPAGKAETGSMEPAAFVYAVNSLEELRTLTEVLLANPKNAAGR